MGAAVPYIIQGVSQKLSTGDTSWDTWIPHDIGHALLDPANIDGAYAKEKAEKKAEEDQQKATEQAEQQQAQLQAQADADAEVKNRELRRRQGMLSTLKTSSSGLTSQASIGKKTLLGQ